MTGSAWTGPTTSAVLSAIEHKIVLNSTEQTRVLVLNQVEAGVLIAAQLGQLLGPAERQQRWLTASYRRKGSLPWLRTTAASGR